MPKRKRTGPYAAAGRAAYKGGRRYARKRARYNYSRPMGTVAATRGFRGYYGSSVQERKVSDISTAVYQVNTTGSITLLHNPVLGSDYTQRIGRKTSIKSLYVRGLVQLELAAIGMPGATGACMARMIIFIDSQPNGAVPAITDLLVEALPQSQLNLNNRDRFRIVKDREYVYDPFLVSTTATQAIANWGRVIHPVKMYKKLNIETVFNGTNGGTIADINTGALYMLWVGNLGAGTNVDMNAIVSTRVRYKDS